MAHYAFINQNNIVTEVIVGRDEDEIVDGIFDWEEYYKEVRDQKCLRTSYNTLGNQHIGNGIPFRGNYAGIGYTYDPDFDVFIAPRPYPSWKLNYTTYQWEAPVSMPEEIEGSFWKWSEYNLEWIKVDING